MLQLARSEDREAVNGMARQVNGMHVQWRPDLFEHSEELYTVERFDQAVKQRQLYVAVINGAAVGYVRLNMRQLVDSGAVKRKTLFIEEFCVHESCRNQGIGKDMMVDVRALAAAFHCTDLELAVYPQNDEAVGFCQKCGFTIKEIQMQRNV